MYLINYVCSDGLLDEIIEQYGMPDQGMPVGPPPVEFEEVKKFLLFEKFKNLKTKFETADIDHSDKRVRKLDEFFNLIFVFYPSFAYNDLVKLLNRLIDIMSEVAGLKVELEIPPEPEPVADPEPNIELEPAVQPQSNVQPQPNTQPKPNTSAVPTVQKVKQPENLAV